MIADPGSVVISNHALLRYAERRGRVVLHAEDRPVLEGAIRALLRRCAAANPPLRISAVHGPARIYRHGQFTFVMSADSSVLITVIPAMNVGCGSGQRVNQRKRAVRRARTKR